MYQVRDKVRYSQCPPNFNQALAVGLLTHSAAGQMRHDYRAGKYSGTAIIRNVYYDTDEDEEADINPQFELEVLDNPLLNGVPIYAYLGELSPIKAIAAPPNGWHNQPH